MKKALLLIATTASFLVSTGCYETLNTSGEVRNYNAYGPSNPATQRSIRNIEKKHGMPTGSAERYNPKYY